MSTALAAREPDPVIPHEPILALIERASRDGAVDVDKMERLIVMAERAQAKRAELEYDAAMTAAQSEMRPIATDCKNEQTRSRYVSYGALDRVLRPIYTSHGFNLSFGTKSPTPDRVTITCRVSHRAGHTEHVEIDMPADGKGAKGGDVMTKTHATGSAVSYGMRYLIKMIFNVSVGEYDDDGNGASKKPGQDEAIEKQKLKRQIWDKLKGAHLTAAGVQQHLWDEGLMDPDVKLETAEISVLKWVVDKLNKK